MICTVGEAVSMLHIEAPVAYQPTPLREVTALVRQLIERGVPVGLDVETTDLDPWASKLVTLQLGDAHIAYVMDLRHLDDAERVELGVAVRLLFSGRVELMGHNLKF